MDAALLDTDILNEVLKQKNAKVVDRASRLSGVVIHDRMPISSSQPPRLIRVLFLPQGIRHILNGCRPSLSLTGESCDLDQNWPWLLSTHEKSREYRTARVTRHEAEFCSQLLLPMVHPSGLDGK